MDWLKNSKLFKVDDQDMGKEINKDAQERTTKIKELNLINVKI